MLRRRELTFEAKIRILLQVLDALHHAHNEDVVHRDIKPSNVYRQLDGSIKLVDFGLARMMRAETLTLSGAVMGTPHYASPEQLKGEHIDKRTDVYSVGALAFEMFAGRRPFQTEYDSVATIVLKVISEPTPPMDVSLSRAFPEIERIVDKAMSKQRDERYQTAAEMRDDFAAFLESSRDAISTIEIELNTAALATLEEAQQLLATGQKDEAQTLLTTTLKTNPDARALGELLDSTRLRPPSLGATVPIKRDLTPMPEIPTEREVVAAAATVPAPDIGMPTHVLPKAAAAATMAIEPQRSSTVMWWIAGAAAAALLVAAVWVSRPADSSVSSPSSMAATTAPATTAPATTPGTTAGTSGAASAFGGHTRDAGVTPVNRCDKPDRRADDARRRTASSLRDNDPRTTGERTGREQPAGTGRSRCSADDRGRSASHTRGADRQADLLQRGEGRRGCDQRRPALPADSKSRRRRRVRRRSRQDVQERRQRTVRVRVEHRRFPLRRAAGIERQLDSAVPESRHQRRPQPDQEGRAVQRARRGLVHLRRQSRHRKRVRLPEPRSGQRVAGLQPSGDAYGKRPGRRRPRPAEQHPVARSHLRARAPGRRRQAESVDVCRQP